MSVQKIKSLFVPCYAALIMLFISTAAFPQNYGSLVVNPYSLTDLPSDRPAPTFGDLDDDGDMDMVVGDQNGNFYYYENTGTQYEPSFAAPVLNPFSLGQVANGFAVPYLSDIEGDGDLDLIANDAQGNFVFFENTGTIAQPAFANPSSNPFGLSSQGFFAKPVAIDWDGDGDIDIFCIAQTNTGIPSFYYFQNSAGSNATPSYQTAIQNPFSLADPTANVPYFDVSDIDLDSDLDILVSLNGGFEFYENVAGTFLTKVSNPFGLQNFSGAVSVVDMDGDNDPDVLLGNRTFKDYRYFENTSLPSIVTWDGELDNNWNNPTNWDGNSLPTSTDRVVIPEIVSSFIFPTISGDFNVFDVVIEANATITVNFGSLEVGRFIENSGNVFVSSGASLLPKTSIGGSGTFSISRNTTFNIAEGKYSIIGTPITNASTNDLGTLVYKYDENTAYGADGSDRFIEVDVPETMSIGDAYFSAYTGSVLFLGTPNTGEVEIPLAYNPLLDGGSANAGFNLVSNPYSAAISYRSFTSGNADIDGTIYLWDDGGSNLGQRSNSDYIAVTSMGSAGGSGRAGDWDGNIRSAQGFFVKSSTAGTLRFSPSMMVTGNNSDGGFFRTTEERPIIRLALSSGSAENDLLIGFDEKATLGFDRTLDGYKIQSGNPIQFYSWMKDEKMAIQARPHLDGFDEIDLGMDLIHSDSYTLSIKAFEIKGMSLILYDDLLDTYKELREGDAYSFESNTTFNSTRFTIILSDTPLASESETTRSFITYGSGNDLKLKYRGEAIKKVTVFDLGGHIILEDTKVLHTNGQWSTAFPYRGLYILKMETTDGKTFNQKFIKN